MSIYSKGLIRSAYELFRNYRSGASLAERKAPNGLILGNGPSLKQDIEGVLSLRAQGDFDCWCVSFFLETELYEKVRPEFYVLADPWFWLGSSSPEQRPRHENFLKLLHEKTTWPMTIYMPTYAKAEAAEMMNRLRSEWISVRFFNAAIFDSTSDAVNHWVYRNLWAMPRCQNVLIGGLYLMVMSGYQNVYVLGADHSWLKDVQVKDDNTVMVGLSHFYDESALRPIRNLGVGRAWDIGYILHIFSIVFKQYEILEKFAKHMGVKIINASSYSWIDAFERMGIEKIISRFTKNANGRNE